MSIFAVGKDMVSRDNFFAIQFFMQSFLFSRMCCINSLNVKYSKGPFHISTVDTLLTLTPMKLDPTQTANRKCTPFQRSASNNFTSRPCKVDVAPHRTFRMTNFSDQNDTLIPEGPAGSLEEASLGTKRGPQVYH